MASKIDIKLIKEGLVHVVTPYPIKNYNNLLYIEGINCITNLTSAEFDIVYNTSNTLPDRLIRDIRNTLEREEQIKNYHPIIKTAQIVISYSIVFYIIGMISGVCLVWK